MNNPKLEVLTPHNSQLIIIGHQPQMAAPLIFINGSFATLDRERPQASAVAVRDGRFLAVGDLGHVMRYREAGSQVIDLNGRTVIPGLNDSRLHLIRGGLIYNLELRWEGVPSLADALRMLQEQADRTPNPQWVHLLFWMSLIPYVTAWAGEHPLAPVPVALYGRRSCCRCGTRRSSP